MGESSGSLAIVLSLLLGAIAMSEISTRINTVANELLDLFSFWEATHILHGEYQFVVQVDRQDASVSIDFASD